MSRFGWDDGDGDLPAVFLKVDLHRRLTSGRGQRILRDVLDGLVMMPQWRLVDGWIARPAEEEDALGDVCAVGAYAAWQRVKAGESWAEAIDVLAERWGGEQDDAWATELLGRKAGLAKAVAIELSWLNDEQFSDMTPEDRWHAMVGWVWQQIILAEAV
jgi:hypothetical protein